MGKSNWRERAGTPFTCEKQPAHGTRGMVVTNHPLASAAGMEMLAAGGNAIDAAVAAQFALTVVEPMMVGLIGGTTMHVRLAGGHHTIIDGMSAVPAAGQPEMYQPIPGAPPEVYDVEGRDNLVGPKSVATPGSLRAWCLALDRYGTMSLADVMQPAIRHASRGFAVTPYLSDCIAGASPDLLQDPFIADRLLPDGDAAEARRAPGAGRLCRGADPDRPAGRKGAARRAAGRPRGRVHGTLRRLRRPQGSHRLPRGRAQADPRPAIAAGKSSARRRPPPRACTSRRC